MSRIQHFRERNSQASPRTQRLVGWTIIVVLFVASMVLQDTLHGAELVALDIAIATVILVGLLMAWRERDCT